MKVGDTLAGRYELRTRVGGGGLGEVYRAHDARSGREVAVKIFNAARCSTAGLLQVQSQITAAMGVSHPGVVLPRVQVAVLMKPPFVALDLLDGQDLAAVIREGAMPWTRALEIVSGCAEALAALASETDAAHRAIKPGNVWICPDGQVRVLDFGVAELEVQPTPPREDGTAVEYRAPEQIEGEPGDARSDVFSLGVLLFELAAGAHPFTGADAAEAATEALAPSAAKISTVAKDPLPPEFEALVARMLARDPEDRPADAVALGRELVAAKRAAEPVAKAPAPTPAPPAKPAHTDDLTTALSLPVFRRPRPAPAPAAMPTPAPAPAETPAPGEPPLRSVAPDVPSPVSAVEQPRGESWLDAPKEAPAPLPSPAPLVSPQARPPKRPKFVPDEPTEALEPMSPTPGRRPVVESQAPARAHVPDDRTEALPIQPARRPATHEQTEALPVRTERRPVADERTEVLASVTPRRPPATPSTAPRSGAVPASSSPDEHTEILLTPSRHALERPAHRPPVPAAQEDSTQVLSGLHRLPPRPERPHEPAKPAARSLPVPAPRSRSRMGGLILVVAILGIACLVAIGLSCV
jgi:serine/threonine protein kinase